MAEHPRKIGTVKTVDMTTGEVVAEKQNAFTVLPCAPDKCPECAVDHAHNEPHDRDSLYYQMRFHGTHGRWPTWTDAMSHCLPEVRAHWRTVLVKRLAELGREIPADLREESGGATR